MSSPTWIETTTAAGFGVTQLQPTYPQNPTDQWILLAHLNLIQVGGSDTITVTPPSGWTLVVGQFTGGRVSAVYHRVGGGAAGQMTWGFSASMRGNVYVLSYKASDETGTINVSGSQFEFSAALSHTIPAIVTTADNCTLVGFWSSVDTSIEFTVSFTHPNNLLTERVNIAGISGAGERATLISEAAQGQAGSSGTKLATTNANSIVHMIMVALKPTRAPSMPTLTKPNGGESISIGAQYVIQWQPSTSPVSAQSTLKYHIQYSRDGGGTWTDVVALTSAGVTSHTWSTTGLLAGTFYKLRIRANDPAIGKFSLDYDQSDNYLSIVTETAPSTPTGLSPSSGVRNKSSALTLSWMHGAGEGNPQTEFTLQWSRDGFASHTVTVGPTTTGTQSTSINFSAEAQGAIISWKVKTKGATMHSAYSQIVSFTAAVPPATPNITAPTAASPPTIPQPTITFTEADPFTERAMRVSQGGSTVFNPGFVVSTVLSFQSPYPFSNGIQYSLHLKSKNQYGLESAEDTETFTAAWSGPATPTMTLSSG